MRKTKANSMSGFTLVEMAIVMVIIGVLTVPLFLLYQRMTENKMQEDTRIRLKEMNGQISAFFETQYDATGKSTPHYPCPSDRALPVSNPLYRKQFNNGNCSLAQLAAMPAPLVYVKSLSYQPPVCTPNFGFCIVQGNADKDGDGGLDPILIGGVPIRDTLPQYVANKGGDRFPETDVLDGWGSNFTYAVSYNLATYSDTNTKNNMGVISVVDENNLPTAGINNDAHYIVVSHGPDGKGGYSTNGSITNACGTVAAALDNDNCDNDSRFRSALGRYAAKLPSYFDDYLVAYTRQNTGIWESVGSTGSIHNLNKKNVGIGTSSPTTKLDISGDLRADYNALAGSLCKQDATGNAVDCFDINAITGSGVIKCPNASDPATYTIMRGISNGKAICAAPPAGATTATKSFTCSAGQFINSINIATGLPSCIN